ncbi:MAG: dTDP-6-deoxy-3,4-keto-hexulose isomerase, partial [Clostridia bacterium]|nr:dTDP-6-deoxy-3,4-keto-hexulose isomerase [Clostridia bacterium]
MGGIKIIEGEIFRDHRGQISSLNDFHFEGVRRTYIIHHPDATVVRGWHAHQHERKWFYCVKGSFTLALVEIDDWEQPSQALEAQIFELSEERSQLVCVPAGYANCLKAKTDGAVMLVLSNKTLDEALGDSWRYDASMWV